MTKSQLKEILRKHKIWLRRKEGGERAVLIGADLHLADLRRVNLFQADLHETNLCEANLRGANLYQTDLRGANLCKANLFEADLRGADLRRANLNGVNLSKADLRGADLRGADLRGVDLRGANLNCAHLYDADYDEVMYDENTVFFALCCPEEGSFIGFKKADDKIIKLLIPEDAKRSSATARQCRCSKAKVLSITNIDGSDSGLTEINSNYDKDFIYKVGEEVEVPDFDKDRWKECSPGIHFFITRDEAVKYN